MAVRIAYDLHDETPLIALLPQQCLCEWSNIHKKRRRFFTLFGLPDMGTATVPLASSKAVPHDLRIDMLHVLQYLDDKLEEHGDAALSLKIYSQIVHYLKGKCSLHFLQSSEVSSMKHVHEAFLKVQNTIRELQHHYKGDFLSTKQKREFADNLASTRFELSARIRVPAQGSVHYSGDELVQGLAYLLTHRLSLLLSTNAQYSVHTALSYLPLQAWYTELCSFEHNYLSHYLTSVLHLNGITTRARQQVFSAQALLGFADKSASEVARGRPWMEVWNAPPSKKYPGTP